MEPKKYNFMNKITPPCISFRSSLYLSVDGDNPERWSADLWDAGLTRFFPHGLSFLAVMLWGMDGYMLEATHEYRKLFRYEYA